MTRSNKTKKVINTLLFLIFVWFAIIQLNDPDGWLWFAIYIIIAILCLASNFKRIPITVLWLVIAGLLDYASFHISWLIDYLQTDNKEEIFGEMVYDKPYLEGSREFLGLLIAASGVFYLVKSRNK